MSLAQQLDYRPLTVRSGLLRRVHALGSSPLAVVGATVGVLLVLVPAVVLVSLVATGNATDVGGLVFLGMLLAAGVYVCAQTVHQAGTTGGFGAFAEANDLVWSQAVSARAYAGSLFADGSHVVHQSVRGRDAAFLEVGERFPVTTPSLRPRELSHRVPELFLRARLAGGSAGDPREGVRVTPELRERLDAFAGDHVVELTDDELTLFGTRALGVDDPDRVRAAFALVGELADLNARAPWATGPPQREAVEPVARRRRPVLVVLGTLALLVGGSLGIALVMSLAEQLLPLRGDRPLASLVVLVLVGGVLAGAGWLARVVTSRRRGT